MEADPALLVPLCFGDAPKIARTRPGGPSHERFSAQEPAMRWVIVAVFLLGMISSFKWYEARTSERRTAFGVLAVVAFTLTAVLGSTMI
jgi:hypothetical protein